LENISQTFKKSQLFLNCTKSLGSTIYKMGHTHLQTVYASPYLMFRSFYTNAYHICAQFNCNNYYKIFQLLQHLL